MQILLSTFNGTPFLNELLDSLIAQSFADISITIRDDGSTDGTVEILREFKQRYPSTDLTLGKNVGVCKSYFRMLEEHPSGEYYGFCDQDDIWEAEKIKRAIEKLSIEDVDVPALYFSRLEYVNNHSKHIRYSWLPKRAITFENALVENIATGCTIVLNQAARNLIVSRIPSHCIMHDWWCLLVVSAFGKVIYDDYPTVKYRLHDNNVVGAPTSLFNGMVSRISRFSVNYTAKNWVHAQAIEFQRLYNDVLPGDKSLLLDKFIDSRKAFYSRIKYALIPDVFRQRKIDNFILRVLILLNRY